MRRFYLMGLAIGLLWLPTLAAFADTFHLNDGRTLTADVLSANDANVQLRVGEGKYERVPWANFSQEDLKKFARVERMARFAEPFIELTPEEKIKKTEAPLKEVPRLERPPRHTLLGAMAGSSVGLFALLLIYAANLYAGYEVAIFRAQPVALVCGVAAVLPLIGPVLFLSMPTHVRKAEAPADAEAPAETTPAAAPAAAEAARGGLAVARSQAAPAAPAHPPAQVFQRGQFTFNRRFFETKFPGFFGVIRRDAEKDMVLLIKAARGQFVTSRITRIAGNDLHVEVVKGTASQEVLVPFVEIQEVQLKHKDA